MHSRGRPWPQALFHQDYNAVEANVQAMLPQVAAAAEAGADIVVFPETVINGADSLPLNCTWQVRVGCVCEGGLGWGSLLSSVSGA